MLAQPPLTDEPVPGVEDLAVLLYTGGTTGIPKAARLSHGNLMANVAQVNAWLPQVRFGEERLVGLLPFSHSFGLTACLNWPMSQGAQIIVLPRFEINGFIKMLRKHRPTMLPGVPTLFVALINDPRLAKLDLSALWGCISGSAPLPVEVRDRFEALSGCRMLEGYGLTEAGPVTHFNPVKGKRPLGSMGMPLPGTLARVMDQETGTKELPPGEVGELAIQGPQVMQGYWQRPAETAVVLRDGWLYTGDLARRDADGYFYIVERKKDMIISGGYNIYPREVEEVLYQFPGVQEAVAFGVPDAYRGEVVKVVIVPRNGVELDVQEIRDFCGQQLALYKIPKIIEFRPELPKSLVGKVLRRLLREEAAAGSRSRRKGLRWTQSPIAKGGSDLQGRFENRPYQEPHVMRTFQEIRDNYRFSDLEAETLRGLLPVVEPHSRQLIRDFYNLFLQMPDAAKFLQDEAKSAHLEAMHRDWLLDLFKGPYDERYFQRLQRVGQAHVNIGMSAHFVYVGMNFLRQQLCQIVDAEVEPKLRGRGPPGAGQDPGPQPGPHRPGLSR